MNSVCPTCGAETASGRLRGLCGHCLASSLLETTEAGLAGVISGHELVDEIARGGMGIVYRARQFQPQREVALKMLLPQGATASQRERFLLEARALASLDHPGLLPVYQSGESSGVPFFTMKLARGGALTERRANYTRQWREVARLIAELADAVHFAHRHGVLHRDLKPGNVLFDTDSAGGAERAYVADFGLAKVAQVASDLTQSVAMLGTPHYVAPEVAERGAIMATTASDVYSLGVMLYELLAQRRPFEAETIPALLREIVEKEPTSIPHCPRDLQVIARKALSKNPAARYGTAQALADDLRRWLAGQPVKARAASLGERLWAWSKRQPALAAVTVLFLLSLTAGAILLVTKNRALTRGLADEQLARATALQQSGDARHRDEALALIKDAVHAGADRDAAREQAITLLASPAWREGPRVSWRPGAWFAIAPDFSYFAEMFNGVLRLRPLLAKGAEEEIACPAPPVGILAVLTHALRIAVRLEGGGLHLYDVEKKSWTREWPGIHRLLFSPDGRWLARTVKGSSEVFMEDLGNEASARSITSMHKDPRPLAFTPDGSRLAVVGSENARVETMDVPGGKVLTSIGHPWRHHLPVKSSWRPDGRALAVATDVTEFFVWQFESNSLWQRRIRGHNMEILSLAWHPGSEWIASTSFDNTVRLWEVSSGRELLRLPAEVAWVGFSADGSRMLCEDDHACEFSVSAFSAPQVVHQVELNHGSPDTALQRGPFGVAVTPDGHSAIVAGDGAWLIDAATGSISSRLFNGYSYDATIANETSLFLLTADRMLRSELLQSPDGVWTATTPEPALEKRGLIRLSWSPAKRLLAASTRNGVALYRIDDFSRPEREFSTGDIGINVVAYSPDGRWLVAGTDGEGSTSFPTPIFDTTSAATTPCATLPLAGYVQSVFSPDSHILYTVCPKGLMAWEAGTWKCRWTHPSPTAYSKYEQIALSGDGRVLAAAVFPHGIRLYAAASGTPLATIDHSDRRGLAYIALDKHGGRLVANGAAHVVQLWDLELLREKLRELDLDWQDPQ